MDFIIEIMLALWFGVLIAIGYGQKYLDFAIKAMKWLSANCFPFYIWHLMCPVLCRFYLSKVMEGISLFAVSVIMTYILAFAVSLISSKLKSRLQK